MSHYTTPRAISLTEKLKLVEAHWTPHRIARFDGHQMMLARIQGDFIWHDHQEHDEVFMPLTGSLMVDIEEPDGGKVKEVRVDPGEVLVVPAGARHRPRTVDGGEVTLLLIDPLDVKHTGDVRDDRTVDEYPVI
ncbi:MAG: mannose-6-phosphate isomerase-like protein (cupin superfamily) [Planctomycetota bacterium]|jgi:mannose-6-phosphate isomerase-like protein (cupin superfamily)